MTTFHGKDPALVKEFYPKHLSQEPAPTQSASTQSSFTQTSSTNDEEREGVIEEEDASSPPTTTVFVGDLSIFVSESDLLAAFQAFGTIFDVKVMRCEETRKNLSYGFVKFADALSAAAAMEALHGQLLCGRPMR
jgi:RNA recognition motif-containing protein